MSVTAGCGGAALSRFTPWRVRLVAALFALVYCGTLRANDALASVESAPAGDTAVSIGNRAFRSGQYRTAIASYLAVKNQDNEHAIASFNIGVCYYRLGEYVEAERWLREATRDPRLAARARYNLGLVYWADGNVQSARSAFRVAEQLTDSGELRSLSLRAQREMARGADAPALRRSQSMNLDGGLSVVTSLQAGSDDNVFRTPDVPYADQSQTGSPVVTPVKASGTFAEVALNAQNVFWSGRHTILRAAYEFDGRYYTDRNLQAGDEFAHNLGITARKLLGPDLEGNLYIRMSFGRHDETNFDPDTGIERAAGGENISDRFKYWNSIASAEYQRPVGPVRLGVHAITELRDYDSVKIVSEYDNRFYQAGATVSLSVLPHTMLRAGYDRYRRDYTDRLAIGADATVGPANPTLAYEYDQYSMDAIFDLDRATFEVGFERSNRTDTFAGYNNYRRDTFHLLGQWRPVSRLRLEVSGSASTYDYPNAFAFDNPAAGLKTMGYMEARLRARFSVTRSLQIVAEARYWDADSSDPRMNYSRLQLPVGVIWSQRF